jgi:predicted regulator of Ras-like GTPase activity (Roadblock/LC7/MglB family)
MNAGLVLYEDESRQIRAICERLTRDANAKVVFVVDKNGQLIASSGQDQHFDTTSLASLTAGNVAAMGGLANLIGEKEFPTQYHEGERESLHLSVVGGRAVLVVVFDARSSLGLVRLRVKKAGDELGRIFAALAAKQAAPGAHGPLAEITDDDIDNLFADDVGSR